MKKRYSFLIILVLVLILTSWVYLGVRSDPRITIDKLRGLTPNEVISRLGQPDVDPRLPAMGGWSIADQADGTPLALKQANPPPS
jgi:hypothetical protein